MGLKLEAVSRFITSPNNDWAIDVKGDAYKAAYAKEAETLNGRIVERYAAYLKTIDAREAGESFATINPSYSALFSDQDGDLCLEFDADVAVEMLVTSAAIMKVSLPEDARQKILDNCLLAALGQDATNGMDAAQYKNTPPSRELPEISAEEKEARRDAAKITFQNGRFHYENGKFDKALAEFKIAYELSGLTDLQYGIAQCYEKLFKPKEAIAAYKLYLSKGQPTDTEVEYVRKRISVLEEAVSLKAEEVKIKN